MKKILSVILALTMIFVAASFLGACGKKDSGADKTTTEAANAPSGKNANAAVKTIEKGKLIMATNATFPPYEFIEGGDNKVVGIDPETAKKIAEKLNLELVINDVEFDSIIAGVKSGKYDMGMAGMTVNPDRLKNVDFSDPYAKGVQVVIVKEGSDIKTADDLKSGKKIGTQQGTTGDTYAKADFGDENVISYKNGPDATQALLTGKVDAVLIDNLPAKEYIKAGGLKILDAPYTDEDYAICFKKGNEALKNAVNEALKELKADGSLKAISDKYIKAK